MNDVLSSWLPTQLKDGWRLTKNREFCSIVNGYPCPSEGFNTNGEGIPIVRIRDITSGSTNTYFKGEYPSEQIINTNDLLIGMDGDFNVRLWSSGKALLNQRCCNVRCKDELIKKYLYFVLPIQLKIINELKNSTTVKHLNNEDILDAQIVIPNKYDHISKIVNYLDSKTKCIDRILSVLNDILEKIIAYRQSLITRAVTKGLDPNVEMKDSGVEWIGSIPREWKTSKISFVSDVTLGKMLCPRQTDSEQTLETYLCAGSISWDGVKDYIKEMWFSSKEKSELLLIAGDVLVVEGGAGFGMTTLYKGEHSPCYFQNSIIRVRGHHNVMTSDFINYWMRFTYTAYLKTVCNEATFSHYTKEKVSETPILVPPLNEQKKIADFCKLVDERVKTICAGIENQISKLNEYRSSLISAAVTGQLAIDEEASA